MQIEEVKEILKNFSKGKVEKDKLEPYRGGYKMGYFYTVGIQEAIDTVLNELEKKDKVIDEIEDLCIRKSDEEGQEYGGVIIWNFAHKIMDIIKKARTNK